MQILNYICRVMLCRIVSFLISYRNHIFSLFHTQSLKFGKRSLFTLTSSIELLDSFKKKRFWNPTISFFGTIQQYKDKKKTHINTKILIIVMMVTNLLALHTDWRCILSFVYQISMKVNFLHLFYWFRERLTTIFLLQCKTMLRTKCVFNW